MSELSRSAKKCRLVKEQDPEKYSEILRKQAERYKERKRQREEYWATGTREALDDKEAYDAKRRAISRKSFHKRKLEESGGRITRTASNSVPSQDRVNRKMMTPEERRAHDATKRKERKDKKSRQKKVADKAAHAKYMREWRQAKKKPEDTGSTGFLTPTTYADTLPKASACTARLPTTKPSKHVLSLLKPSTNVSSLPRPSLVAASANLPGPSSAIDMPGPSSGIRLPESSSFDTEHPELFLPATRLPEPSPHAILPEASSPSAILPEAPCNASTPKLKRNYGCVNLSASQARMRQHCYNTTSKMKAVLKASFNSEESANMSAHLVLRKTPQKRMDNLNRLLDYPEVQAFCRKKLNLEPKKTKRKSTTADLNATLKSTARKRFEIIKSEITRFYKNPAVSRVLPHKRYATKWGPGYVLIMTLKNAHRAYQEHHGRKVGFSTFASLRPRNVRRLGSIPVDTCLCVTCTNVKLKIDSLNKILGKEAAILPETKLLNFILCPFQGQWPKMSCVSGACKRCQDPVRPFTGKCFEHYFEKAKWFHWERREAEGKKKLDIHAYEGTVGELMEQLAGDLECPTKGTTFAHHLFTAYWQQSQYDLAKSSLQQGQVMLVQDFAENRKATYGQEVKSAHFGKAQVSLHPTVCFYKNTDGQLVRHVAMFFSDDIGHDYHAVHCYTRLIVEILQKETAVGEVIIWSDGAASQYKGRGTFADLSLYPFPVQRNYFGSEHGKGEADGETGRFSQAMARAVAKGQNFRHAEDMVKFGRETYSSDPLRKYSFVLVGEDQIKRDRPETDVGTLPGTRSLHQLLRKADYVLAARKLSCFCTSCREENPKDCGNKEYVQDFEIFKVKPSKPVSKPVSSLPTTATMANEESVLPNYSSSDIPHVGEWLEIVGTLETKKSKDMIYFANVVSPPVDGSTEFFYCQFYKKTAAGAYVVTPRTYHIVPGTAENYRWRRIAAPQTNARGHFFFQ